MPTTTSANGGQPRTSADDELLACDEKFTCLVYYEDGKKIAKTVSSKEPDLCLSVRDWLVKRGKVDPKVYTSNYGVYTMIDIDKITMRDHLFMMLRGELVPKNED